MKRRGICSVCACTEADACPEGCSWANRQETLCSSCSPLSEIDRAQMKEIARQDLRLRLDMLKEEYRANLLELHTRLAVLTDGPAMKPERGVNKKPRSRKQTPVPDAESEASMSIREIPERKNEDISNFIPVVITAMMLGAGEDGKPRFYMLEFVTKEGKSFRVGMSIEQMNQLKESLDDCFVKFPELMR